MAPSPEREGEGATSFMMKLEFAPTPIPASVAYLQKRFYRANSYLKGEHESRRGRNPIKLLLNPLGFKHSSSLSDDIMIGIYYQSFFVKIEGNGILGPHAVFLYFQIERGSIVHLGTAQISSVVLSNRKAVRAELRELILKRRYFASDATLNQVVMLPWDKCTPRMLDTLAD